MLCRNCAVENAETARYCRACGQPISLSSQPRKTGVPTAIDTAPTTVVINLQHAVGVLSILAAALTVMGTFVPYVSGVALSEYPYDSVFFVVVGVGLLLAGILSLGTDPRRRIGHRMVVGVAVVVIGYYVDVVLFAVAFEGREPDIEIGFFALVGGGLLALAAASASHWTLPLERGHVRIPPFATLACLLVGLAYGLSAVLPRFVIDGSTCCGLTDDLDYPHGVGTVLTAVGAVAVVGLGLLFSRGWSRFGVFAGGALVAIADLAATTHALVEDDDLGAGIGFGFLTFGTIGFVVFAGAFAGRASTASR